MSTAVRNILSLSAAYSAQGHPQATPSNQLACLTVDAAAATLAVSPSTIRRQIDSGEIKAFHVGKCLRIRVTEIERYLQVKAKAV